MKKLLVLLLALMMAFSFVACGEEPAPADSGTVDSGTEQSGNDGSDQTASTDYFYDHYDFCEEWMMPDGGVYTGYNYVSPDSNEAGNEFVSVRIYDITDEQIEAYITKIGEQGYENLIGDSYSKDTGSAIAMIEICDYREDGYIDIIIDPSI